MSDLIAKKYAKALILRSDLDEVYEYLCALNTAFALPKFKILVEASRIKREEKMKLIASFFTQMSPSFENLLRLLIQNSRLSYIPQIVKELKKEISSRKGIYTGIIHTKDKLSEERLVELENKLGIKLGVKLILQNSPDQESGVKISLEELGYELSFSMKELEHKMSEFILKNI